MFLLAANASVEGKVSKPLKKLLKKLIIDKTQEDFAVADAKLASNIKVCSYLLSSCLVQQLQSGRIKLHSRYARFLMRICHWCLSKILGGIKILWLRVII